MFRNKIVTGLLMFSSLAFTLGAAAAPQTFTGTVSDTMCGKTHMIPGKSDAECIRECLKAKGTTYALVVGDKVYALAGENNQFNSVAGKRVKVTGELTGKTLKVQSIAAVR
jgi:hypothetical protein